MIGDDIPPAVTKAVDDLYDPDLHFMRTTADGLVRVTADQMTDEERLLALALLHKRQTRKMT